MTVEILARLKTKPEYAQTVHELLLSVVNETHKEEGCKEYQLHVDVEHSHHFVMVEKWRSQSDLDKHSHSAHIKALKSVMDKYFTEFSLFNMTRLS